MADQRSTDEDRIGPTTGPLVPRPTRLLLDWALAEVTSPDRREQDAGLIAGLFPPIDRYPDIVADARQTLAGDVDSSRRFVARLRFLAGAATSDGEDSGEGAGWGTRDLQALRERLVGRLRHQPDEAAVVSADDAQLMIMAAVHAGEADADSVQANLAATLDQLAGYERLRPVLAEAPAAARGDESAQLALRAVIDRLAEESTDGLDALPPVSWPRHPRAPELPDGQAVTRQWLLAVDSLLAWEEVWKAPAYKGKGLMPAVKVSPTTACAGTLLSLTGHGFGTKPGKVRFRTPPGKGQGDILKIGPTSYIDVDPQSWTDTKIEVVVPQFASCGVLAIRIPTGTVMLNGKTFDVYASIGPVAVGGTLPEITDLRADGVSGHLVTSRGSLVDLSWYCCPADAEVALDVEVDGKTLWTKSGLSHAGSEVLAVGGTKTTDYTVTATAKTACGSTTETMVVTVHRPATAHIAMLEITQGIQHFWAGTTLKKTPNGVPLISGKPTLVRAYLGSDQDTSFNDGDVEDAIVHLHGYYEGGGELPDSPLAPINPGSFKAGSWGLSTDRKDLRRTANFLIPESWMLPGPSLRLEARLQLPPGSLDSVDPQNETATLSGVRFWAARPLDVVVVLVDFIGTCDPKWPNCNGAPSMTDVATTLQAVRRMYPTDKLRIFLPEAGDRILKYKGDKGCGVCGGFGCLIHELSDIAKDYDNDDHMVWWAAVEVGVHGVGGCGSSTHAGAHGFAASRVTAVETTWHEFGHAYGRPHTFDDGNYPKYGYANSDSIGEYGVDVAKLVPWSDSTANDHLYSPYTASDYMSYDPAPTWVSPYTHTHLMHAYFATKASGTGVTTSIPGAKVVPFREERLVVCGTVWTETAQVSLEPLYHAPLYDRPLTGPETEFSLALVDVEGRTLLSEPIRVQGSDAHGDDRHRPPQLRIAQTLRFEPEAAALEVRKEGEVVHRVERPEHGPRIEGVELNRDGERWELRWDSSHPEPRRLLHGVAVTYDDGERWQRLRKGFARQHLDVDPQQLAGGDRCRFRVFTTDGFNTVHADTEVFSAPLQPPLIVPLEPEDGATVTAGEPVRLEVEAISPRFGSLDGESIRWASELQGPLGTGRELVTELIEGEHQLTIEAGTAPDSTATHDLRVWAVAPGEDR